MPHDPPLRWMIDRVPAFSGKHPEVLKAAGSRPITEENASEVALPPAGASRGDTLFAVVGIALVAALLVSILWVLVNRR